MAKEPTRSGGDAEQIGRPSDEDPSNAADDFEEDDDLDEDDDEEDEEDV
jgi:hypothetical protein